MNRSISGPEILAWVLSLVAFGLLWAEGEKIDALKKQQENSICIPYIMKAD